MTSKFASASVRILKDVDARVFDELKNRLGADKRVVKVGFPAGKQEADETPVAMVAAVHEFGAPQRGIPERPFLRVAIRKNKDKYHRLNHVNLIKLIKGQTTVDTALSQLGEMAKGDVQQEIRNGDFAPLKPETVKAKGSSKPLIDSGQMVQSVSWELGDRDAG